MINGFDVLDADTPGAVEELEERLPLGPRVRTGGGGMHFYFKHAPGTRNWTKRLPGVDFRADGGYVVLAGSIHPNRRQYEWVDGTSNLALPEAPAWLREIASKPPSGARTGPPFREGERNQRLFERACAIRAKGHAVLPEIRRQNANLCDPPLGDDEVQRIAASAERYPLRVGDGPEAGIDVGTASIDDKDELHCVSSAELGDGRIVEEILTDRGPTFLVYTPDSEHWELLPTVTVDGDELAPLPVPTGLRGALILPDGVEEYGSTLQLLTELEAWGLRGYDPGKERPIYRLWVRLALASWLLDGFYRSSGDRYAPLLPSVGPPESGKGRLLLVMRYLSYRSLYLLKTTRVPSIFRAIEGWNGTLILDEADLGSSSEASEFIEFLNARAYGVPILRYSTDGARMSYFNSFGMTVIAIRKAYEDAGFNSRTIPLKAEVTAKTNDIDLVASKSWIEQGRALQRKLLLWRLRHLHLIRSSRLTIPTRASFPGVDAYRVRAAVLPLLALKAEERAIVDDLGDLVTEIQERLVAERADSPEGVLLGFVHDRLGSDGYEVVRDEKGFRIEETRTERNDEDVTVVRQVPLTARIVSDALGKELPTRTITRLWRALGQTIKSRARYPGALYASLLVISDHERLEREFARFVPNAQLKAPLFDTRLVQSTLIDSPASELPEQAEHPEQRRPEDPSLATSVQLVQDVQAESVSPRESAGPVPPGGDGS